MKKVKLRLPHLLILAALLAVVGISGAIAYMFRQSADITNTFIPANVTCRVQETFANDLKTSVTVENTSNIPVYIRLRVVTYWQDSKGNIVAMDSPAIKFGSEWAGKTDQWLYDTNNWIYDENNQTFYYKDPVAVGYVTSELLALTNSFTGIKLEKKTEIYNNVAFEYYPVVTFIAEAIQAEPDNVVTESWHVTVGTVDGKKVITGLLSATT